MLRLFLAFFCTFYLTKVNATELAIGIGEQNKIAIRLENEKVVGSHSKVVQCVLSKMDVTIKYQVLPQARMLHLLKVGKLDIGVPLAKSAIRDKYALFSDPIYWVRYSLYTSNKIDLSENLSDYTFAVIRSSVKGGDKLLEHNPNIIEVNTYGQALKMTKSGRIDGVILPAPVIKNLTDEHLSGLQKQDLEVIPVSMYVSKKLNKSDKIVSQLNTLIESCLFLKSN